MTRSLTLPIMLASAVAASAAEVRIEGMQSYTEQQAIDILGARLSHIRTRPASPSRAADAAFLLERLLTRRGFTDPAVDWSLPGNDVIRLTVREGERSFLGRVRVHGVDESMAEEIKDQFRAAHQHRSGLFNDEPPPYLPSNDESGVINGLNFLQARGYWKADVQIERAVRDPRSGEVALTLEANPGPLHRLARPVIQSEDRIDADLRRQLDALTGEIATSDAIIRARRQVTDFYQWRGYEETEIRMAATHQSGRTQLIFNVTPGVCYQLGQVTVTGHDAINDGVIRERFEEMVGGVYNAAHFDKRLRQLYGTGAFEAIHIDKNPHPDGTLDISLHIKEGKPDGYYAYAGAGSWEGGILGAGYYHRNLLGELWNFNTELEISEIGLLGEARITNPWFLGRDLRLTPRAYLLTRSFDGYSKTEAGFDFEFERKLTENYSLLVSQRNAYVTLASKGIPTNELGPDDYNVHTIGLTQRYDRRNDPTLPSDGYYLELTTELGIAAGDASVGFTRIQGRAGIYQPVIEDTSFLAARLQGGVIIPPAGASNLPIDLLYFNGGASMVRSFRERQLGPVASNGDPRGGEAYWAANFEYIHKVAGPVKLVAFVDAGALETDHREFGSGDVKYAAGLGLRIDLPIGPVRLEYGHALNPDANDPDGTFHFAIGTAF